MPPDPTPNPAPIPDSDTDPGYDVPDRPWLVHGAILLAFLLFCGTVLLLYSRWADTVAPNSTVYFTGHPSMDGTEVRIDGPALNSSLRQTLSRGNGFEARFAVPAGSYLVRISHPQQAIPPRNIALAIRDGVASRYDISKLLPATQPTTPPTSNQELGTRN